MIAVQTRAMTTALNGSPAGRVAIVTGGSRGVGGATVRRLAARGYAVVVNYLHDQRAAESTVEAILAGNSDAVAVRADVADDLDVQRLFAETIAAFGGIDVVVHAAGSRITAIPVTEAGLDEFDALVRINTRATFVVNREAARHLRNGGAIVNLSSSAEDSSLRTYGLYAATKAATDVLTRALALELRERDITVNAVSPAVRQAVRTRPGRRRHRVPAQRPWPPPHRSDSRGRRCRIAAVGFRVASGNPGWTGPYSQISTGGLTSTARVPTGGHHWGDICAARATVGRDLPLDRTEQR